MASVILGVFFYPMADRHAEILESEIERLLSVP
jgi:hypothetical protein